MGQARTGLYLAGLLLACALITSRLGLVLHEFVGHGGAAMLVGGHVTKVHLFWFAGGWINYEFPAPPSIGQQLFISMGGIIVEVIVGLVTLAIARRGDSLGRKLARAMGATMIMHGTWYFANGAWSGWGDGLLLYNTTGTARFPIAIAAALVVCTIGFLTARAIIGPLRGTQRTFLAFVAATVLAGGILGGLYAGELRLRADPVYSVIMQSEQQREVAMDLAKWEHYEQQKGEISAARRAAEKARLEDTHHTFPFGWVLGIAAVLSVLAGAWKSTRIETVIEPRLLTRAAILASASVALVIAIDLVTR
ncbi:MAG: hypothetical protein QM831_08395 [Kofleriaceae bacterium]